MSDSSRNCECLERKHAEADAHAASIEALTHARDESVLLYRNQEYRANECQRRYVEAVTTTRVGVPNLARVAKARLGVNLPAVGGGELVVPLAPGTVVLAMAVVIVVMLAWIVKMASRRSRLASTEAKLRAAEADSHAAPRRDLRDGHGGGGERIGALQGRLRGGQGARQGRARRRDGGDEQAGDGDGGGGGGGEDGGCASGSRRGEVTQRRV